MRRALVALLPVILLSGCVSMNISADRTNIPVSASPYVFDEQHRILGPSELQVTHVFRLYRERFKIFWSLIPLGSGEWDLSDELNEAAAAANGEAITDLTVEARACPGNAHPLQYVLPVWPSCGTFIVSGKVVRRVPRGKAAP